MHFDQHKDGKYLYGPQGWGQRERRDWILAATSQCYPVPVIYLIAVDIIYIYDSVILTEVLFLMLFDSRHSVSVVFPNLT